MRCILRVQICINVVLVSSAYSASHLDSILFHRPFAGFRSFMCAFGIQFAYFGSGDFLVPSSCERDGVQSRWQLLYLTSQYGSRLTWTIIPHKLVCPANVGLLRWLRFTTRNAKLLQSTYFMQHRHQWLRNKRHKL